MFHDYVYDINRFTMTAYCDVRGKRIDLNAACTGPSDAVLWAEEEQRLLDEAVKLKRVAQLAAQRTDVVVGLLSQLVSQWASRSNWQGTQLWARVIITNLEEAGYLKELT